MDWLLSCLDDNLGIELDAGVRVSHLALADDLSPISDTPDGLRSCR